MQYTCDYCGMTWVTEINNPIFIWKHVEACSDKTLVQRQEWLEKTKKRVSKQPSPRVIYLFPDGETI